MEMSISMEAVGAREQFSQAVCEHSRAMFRAARAVLDSDADAEDAVSEAVLRAWQAWGGLRKQEAVRAWLLKITVNCAREQRRKTGRVVAMENLETVAGATEDPALRRPLGRGGWLFRRSRERRWRCSTMRT